MPRSGELPSDKLTNKTVPVPRQMCQLLRIMTKLESIQKLERDRPTCAYFASDVEEFLRIPTDTIVRHLALRVGTEHAGDEKKQIKAWRQQVDVLKEAISACGSGARSWGLLLELPLLRLGRRIDTILLARDRVLCIEFKVGADQIESAAVEQTLDYALCLRDFHGASRGRKIIPILCATEAPARKASDLGSLLNIVDDVAACVRANAETLAAALCYAANGAEGQQTCWRSYDASPYSPTPDIVTAARSIYAGHTVREIGRSDASADALEATAKELKRIAEHARANGEHVICFVTGEPGSGKTLLGLDLVFSGDAGRVAGEPAALLSGNRPLVRVLQAAIAEDMRSRTGMKAKEAQRITEQGLQTLLGYLIQHSGAGGSPPEHVIVFDEAQRAWDAATGKKLLDREASEPEIFLEILSRLPWACLFCLVGPGQEINTGEGGLGLWGEALTKCGGAWTAFASEAALQGTRGVTGLLDRTERGAFPVKQVAVLHLRSNLRAYRNVKYGQWVEALLAGELDQAAAIAAAMEYPPAFLTRDLEVLKGWLHARRRGVQRVGLLASSGAVRLIAEGIPPSPRSNELDQVVHWFLRENGDYRSSNALEVPLSEFVCQGLEIDYVGLAWGNDLIWQDCQWVPRKMSAPNWQIVRSDEVRQYRRNAYRVLLTRARAGLIIYVPRGSTTDRTADSRHYDQIFEALHRAGCHPLRT